MQIGPIRQPMESLSAFRFRYALFSLKCGLGFALGLAVLVALRPHVDRSYLPLLVMFLYFGLPIGLGMAVLSSFGFFVGGLYARWLEQNDAARRVLPRIKFAVLVLISVPISLFALYWLFRGLTTMETQAFTRGHHRLITPESDPTFFWLSVMGWGATGFGFPVSVYRSWKATFGSRSSL